MGYFENSATGGCRHINAQAKVIHVSSDRMTGGMVYVRKHDYSILEHDGFAPICYLRYLSLFLFGQLSASEITGPSIPLYHCDFLNTLTEEYDVVFKQTTALLKNAWMKHCEKRELRCD
jgi:hypothetical protein